ncbi:hypothetical protein ACFWF9_36440 [Streptomyces roseolus]|uniref:hypothetical protein n=1 Tax=Streptomyces roseolus TaxID=67358 RepID=UPI003663D2BE
MFIVLEREGPRWRIKADTLTAPEHTVDTGVYDAVRATVDRLVRTGQVRPDSCPGPVCFVLQDVDGEPRAREPAAALHAALYGDFEPLARTAPGTPS